MNEIIQKYEAKLDYLNKAVEQTKHLMDEDTLDMMNDMKILLTEVVTDFKDIHAVSGCFCNDCDKELSGDCHSVNELHLCIDCANNR